MSLLRFDGVACARGGRRLFEGLSFVVSPGEALCVSGPNGVGKSSLIRIAAGLLRPVAGSIAAARCAWMGEAMALDPERPLAAALAFWAGIDGAAPDAVAAALAELALDPIGGVPVRLLSTGQRRRAAFARVLAAGAPLWLLDEPANGLDAAAVARLEAAIARHRAGGGAVLIASHAAIALSDARGLALEGGA